MAVTSIQRDQNNNVCLVRMTTTDDSTVLTSTDYIANQMTNIRALNSGFWQWFTTDMLLVSCSNGNFLAAFTNDTFSTLYLYGDQGSGFVNPGTANQFAYYATSGSAVSGIGPLTNGHIFIGSTGAAPVASTINSGQNISIISGPGSISVGTVGYASLSFIDQGSPTVNMVPYTVYLVDNGSTLVTLTLPTSATLGSIIQIVGSSAGGWTIAQNSGQQIHVNTSSTTVGTAGSVSSTGQYNQITLMAISTAPGNYRFVATSFVGTLTIV
jgi:hypothetical protein